MLPTKLYLVRRDNVHSVVSPSGRFTTGVVSSRLFNVDRRIRFVLMPETRGQVEALAPVPASCYSVQWVVPGY